MLSVTASESLLEEERKMVVELVKNYCLTEMDNAEVSNKGNNL